MNRRDFVTKLLSIPVAACVTKQAIALSATPNAAEVEQVFAAKKVLDAKVPPKGVWSESLYETWAKDVVAAWRENGYVGKMMTGELKDG